MMEQYRFTLIITNKIHFFQVHHRTTQGVRINIHSNNYLKNHAGKNKDRIIRQLPLVCSLLVNPGK